MGVFDRKDEKDKSTGNKGKAGVPDFSNVRSGGSSTAPPGKPAQTDAGTRTYTVVQGDSLSKIAKREYGDANKWRQIYEANKDVIKDPDLIYPGQTLRLPPSP